MTGVTRAAVADDDAGAEEANVPHDVSTWSADYALAWVQGLRRAHCPEPKKYMGW